MFYNRHFSLAIALFSALLLVLGSGTLFAVSTDQDLRGVTEHSLAQASDPAGDTAPGYGPEFDIRTVRGFQYENKLALLVSTHGNNPFLDGDAEPYFVVPRFDIDTDQNGATGIESAGDALGFGNSGIGADYSVDFLAFDPTTQSVPVLNAAAAVTGTASVFTLAIGSDQESERFVYVEIPLAALGNDDGRVDFTVTMGDIDGFSDTAPDVGFVTSSL